MISREQALELFSYDRDSGVLTNRVARGRHGKYPAGSLAGCLSGPKGKEYISVRLNGKSEHAHRIIFLMETGEIPQIIRHENGDKTDNRWSNMIAATFKERHGRAKYYDLPKGEKLSYETAHRLFQYDPFTGILRNKVDRNRNSLAGEPVGSKDKQQGYLHVGVAGCYYLVHRVIWLMCYGEWPSDLIDHRDLDKTNNRIENLRLADHTLNNVNKPIQNNNTSGFKGVSLHHGKWRACISLNGETEYLGRFDSPQEAHDAYASAAKIKYGEYARMR